MFGTQDPAAGLRSHHAWDFEFGCSGANDSRVRHYPAGINDAGAGVREERRPTRACHSFSFEPHRNRPHVHVDSALARAAADIGVLALRSTTTLLWDGQPRHGDQAASSTGWRNRGRIGPEPTCWAPATRSPKRASAAAVVDRDVEAWLRPRGALRNHRTPLPLGCRTGQRVQVWATLPKDSRFSGLRALPVRPCAADIVVVST
jgi:hypothetical protein